ncbi:MAG: hypothetical protein ABSD41_08760 [Candidatus Bathyarchaeia archaeon]
MTRTQVIYNEHKDVRTLLIDGRDINEFVGYPIVLSLNNNNQEITKATTDSSRILKDITDVVDLAFRENPSSIELKKYLEDFVNVAGIFLLRNGHYSAAERIYQQLLDSLVKFEAYGQTLLHKGMALHNIAIAQFLERDFDQFIANELRAYDEDVRGGTLAKDSVAFTILNLHYLGSLADAMKESSAPLFQEITGKALANEVTEMLDILDFSTKLFTLQIWKSFQLNAPRDNLYSKCRAFDNAKNLALIAETLLRGVCQKTSNHAVLKAFNAKSKPKLPDLIEFLFKNAPWFSDFEKERKWTQFESSSDPSRDVNNKLSSLLRNPITHGPHDQKLRWILILGLVRNFTAHEFEPNCDITGESHEELMSIMLTVMLNLFDELKTAQIISLKPNRG